jgi:hypothetical protein
MPAATRSAVVGRPSLRQPRRVRSWHLVPRNVLVHHEQP